MHAWSTARSTADNFDYCSKNRRWSRNRSTSRRCDASGRTWSARRRASCSRTSSLSWFLDAFRRLGGRISERERGRYEVLHVPSSIRARDRVVGRAAPVLSRYERIAFDRGLLTVDGRPPAAFVCPGHPLLDAVSDLVLEQYRALLKQGAILIDDRDPGTALRALFYLEHAVRDGKADAARGAPRRVEAAAVCRAHGRRAERQCGLCPVPRLPAAAARRAGADAAGTCRFDVGAARPRAPGHHVRREPAGPGAHDGSEATPHGAR